MSVADQLYIPQYLPSRFYLETNFPCQVGTRTRTYFVARVVAALHTVSICAPISSPSKKTTALKIITLEEYYDPKSVRRYDTPPSGVTATHQRIGELDDSIVAEHKRKSSSQHERKWAPYPDVCFFTGGI